MATKYNVTVGSRVVGSRVVGHVGGWSRDEVNDSVALLVYNKYYYELSTRLLYSLGNRLPYINPCSRGPPRSLAVQDHGAPLGLSHDPRSRGIHYGSLYGPFRRASGHSCPVIVTYNFKTLQRVLSCI